MKKFLLILLALLTITTTFTLTGCFVKHEDNFEISFEEEKENNTEDKNIQNNSNINNTTTENEKSEPQKSIFQNKEKFNLKINDIYCAVPMSYSIFLSSTKAEPLSQLPETLKPDEIIEFDVKIEDSVGKIKLYNMDSIKECKTSSADVVYIEFDTDKINFDFYKDLDGQCTKKEILEKYGENDLGNASLTTDLFCYELPTTKIMFKDVYIEFTIDIETQKVIHFRYGVFTPEYIQEDA